MTPAPGPARITHDELMMLVGAARLAEDCGRVVIVDGPTTCSPAELGAEPCVVVGVDVLATDDVERDEILRTVHDAPVAAAALCMLLRGHDPSADRDLRLLRESAVYSTLQAGAEFQAWRASRPFKAAPADAPAVLTERHDGRLHVTLNRPTHGNAVNRALRDALCEALGLALLDPSVTEVHVRGNGRNFCTGGDLDEFGTFPDPAVAHLYRQERSPARMMARLGDRLTAHVHGRAAGSGIELAAFAGRVVATPDATFQLPELAIGLVPGAGGTVSICDRIGTRRTAWLLLTGRPIDAATALAWGLVDALEHQA